MAEKNKYAYIGLDTSGKRAKGVVEADNEGKAYAMLKTQGIVPEKLKLQTNTGLQMEINIPGMEKRVKLDSLAVFARQFAVLIKAGMPLVRSLQTVAAQTEDKRLQEALNDVLEEVERGNTLSGAMKMNPKVFPDLMTSLITVGEAGGFLDRSLESVARTFKSELELRARVKSAMTYPVIVGIVAVAAVAAMLIFVVPTFEEMFTGMGAELPVPTKILIALSDAMIWVAPLLVGIFGGSFIWFKANKHKLSVRKKLDPLKLKLPVFGNLNKKVSITRFARNLAMMLSAGVPLMNALELVGASAGNYVIEQALDNTRSAMATGKPFSTTLEAENVFPPIVSQMIMVGEESGALSDMLDSIGDFYDDEVKEITESLAAAIEPVMIVGLGGMIGGLVIALYMPMFSMFEVIGGS